MVTAVLGLLAMAGFLWPVVFTFVLDERARGWLGQRWNDRIYRSGHRMHWKSRAGRTVGHIQMALLFGPLFAWLGLVVVLAIALRALGVDLR